MNRTTATCIAGMRSKTTSRTRIHFFPRPREAKPFTRFTRRFLAFGLGILAKRLRWRPERNSLRFELCECSESVIIVRTFRAPLQHAHDGPVRSVLAFGKPAQTVEVTEELVGAVDEL